MKTVYPFLVILFLFSAFLCTAQSKDEEIVFEYAVDLFHEEKYQDAADSFKKFMKDFPASQLKGRAHYNLALSYRKLEDNDKAKATFLEILNEPYNEKDGNSLMEPYTLYKHHSCRMLAYIALDEQYYKEAEEYIGMFDKKFPYQHFCGNEWAAYDMFKAVMLARVYAGTNRTEKAIETLVPYTFSNALASNEEVLEALEVIVSKDFTKDEIKAEVTKAIESLTVTRKKKETIATIRFFNVNVAVENYSLDEPTVESYKQIVRSNEFFKKYLQ